MTEKVRQQLIDWAVKYNDPVYFVEDPISFPREFVRRGACLQDIEIAAVFAAHFAWGRRSMIVRDLERFFDFIEWKPLDYVLSADWRSDPVSIHRTIKWSDTAGICSNLRDFYTSNPSSEPEQAYTPGDCGRPWPHEWEGPTSVGGMERSGSLSGCAPVRLLEGLTASQIRTRIFAQKEDAKAPNKKINMMRRWLVRNDGKVDLGVWKDSSPKDLVIPLDVHVYDEAVALGLTKRHSKDLGTALEITDAFREIFPDDPCLGDFALFGYGVNKD